MQNYSRFLIKSIEVTGEGSIPNIILLYIEQGDVITNITLIGGIGISLCTILIITATILHSIVSVVRENR